MADVPVIAVLTCERPDAEYLKETLRQIDREGGSTCERRLYVDGGPTVVEKTARLLRAGDFGAWRLSSVGERVGSTEATRRVLADVAKLGADVLFFEDDLLLCRRAVTRMIQFAVPAQVSLLSFFDMKEVTAGSPFELHVRPALGADGRGFWGNQCFRLPADVLLWLAHQDWSSTIHWNARMASDIVLGELLNRNADRPHVAYHIPCLVEHVGSVSACFPTRPLGRSLQATNFPGADFDALSLWPVA